MTKRELEETHQFLLDMKINEDDIEILNRIYKWVREIYHTQGKEKLEMYDKNL